MTCNISGRRKKCTKKLEIYRFDLALLSESVAALAFYYVPLNLIKKQQEPLKHVIAPHEAKIPLKPQKNYCSQKNWHLHISYVHFNASLDMQSFG